MDENMHFTDQALAQHTDLQTNFKSSWHTVLCILSVRKRNGFSQAGSLGLDKVSNISRLASENRRCSAKLQCAVKSLH